MKKLMIASAVAFSALAGVCDVASQNIVGYQQVPIPRGYSFFTVTFRGTGTVKELDMKTLVPLDNNGAKITSCVQKIKLSKMTSTGGYVTPAYNYNTAGNRGWCLGTSKLSDGQALFQSGEAFCVNNTLDYDAYLQVSGEVDLQPQSFTIPVGFSMMGNMTPCAVDMKKLVPYNATTGELVTSCVQKIKLSKMTSTGGYITPAYNYNTAGNRGWCLGTSKLSDGQAMIQPGEGFCVNNTLDFPIILKFPSPIAE